jgi:hypothetical protein
MHWVEFKGSGIESGFIKRAEHQMCRSLSHNPPTHMVIPYGYDYKHVCPQCGHVSYVLNNSISC